MVGFTEENLKDLKTPINLKHFYTIVDQRKKFSYFLTLIKLLETEKTIVFVSTADQANFLNEVCVNFKIDFTDKGERENFYQSPVLKIHGFMEQKERSKIYNEFSKIKKGLLICTEVAQRGLDFPEVQIIILFDVSPSYKDYINRVGWTGRIEKNGAALSLLYEEEASYAKKLEENC